MKNVLTNFYNTGNATTGRVENLTIDQANLMQGNTNITLYLTNSLLVGVSAYGTYSGRITRSEQSQTLWRWEAVRTI